MTKEIEVTETDLAYIEQIKSQYNMTTDQLLEATIHEFLEMLRATDFATPPPESE